VDENMIAWIPDIGSSNSRENKYYRTIDMYWHMKAFPGRSLIEKQASFNFPHENEVSSIADKGYRQKDNNYGNKYNWNPL
jgi:hypothetical protein